MAESHPLVPPRSTVALSHAPKRKPAMGEVHEGRRLNDLIVEMGDMLHRLDTDEEAMDWISKSMKEILDLDWAGEGWGQTACHL